MRYQENPGIVKRVHERKRNAIIHTAAGHEDEVAELFDAAAAAACNMYSEAGNGLAPGVISYIENGDPDTH